MLQRGTLIGAFCLVLVLSLLSGCNSLPEDAFKLPPTSLEDRQLQSRKFNTLDHKLLLAAGASVLQDLGYNIDESNSSLGVLTASKRADAKEGSQIILSVIGTLLTGKFAPFDKEQNIRICLVVNKSLDDPNASVARVTIQRIVWDSDGHISRVESIKEPEIYHGFFDKLSKAVFLEANEI